MELIVYNSIPCPVLKFEEPDSYLILFKGESKWIYETSLGYGEIYIFSSGEKHYVLDEVYLHREKGPAYISFENDYEWYQNGNLHRLDGPAMIYEDFGMIKETFFIDNKKYKEEDYWKKIEEMKKDGTYNEK